MRNSYFGTLEDFLDREPRISYKVSYNQNKATLSTRIINKSISPTVIKSVSQRNRLTSKPRSLMTMPRLHSRKNRPEKLSTVSLSPVGTYEKVHEELMYGLFRLTRNQTLIRCMNMNIRNDERKRAQAILEQKALDKVLNSIRNTNTKVEVISQKPFEKFIENKKTANYIYLVDNQNKWIAKHNNFQRPYRW